MRFALYNLYASCRAGSRLSIPPMGLSSQGYNGHIFWDAELWMYPPMLLLNEGIARSMVDYRTDRLAAARRRASAYGYRGVMFPWESDWFGEESTPTWAITGPMEPPYHGRCGHRRLELLLRDPRPGVAPHHGMAAAEGDRRILGEPCRAQRRRQLFDRGGGRRRRIRHECHRQCLHQWRREGRSVQCRGGCPGVRGESSRSLERHCRRDYASFGTTPA